MTSTDVAIRPGTAPAMPSPTEWKGIVMQAETLAQTQIVPREFRGKAHDIIAVSLIGREMGLSPMLAMQYIHVIEGKPSVKPELMNARIRAAGHRIEVEAWDAERCRLKGIRKDGETMTVEFTLDDARRAGLVKERGNWEKYAKAMLWARSLSMLARALFPDVILGASYTPEELGAQVDEDGVPLEAQPPSSVLTDEQRVAAETAKAEDIEDAEIVHEGEVEEPDEEYVAPAPPKPPTAEELHEQAARELFRNGWPMGNCKGGDPLDPEAVDTGSLEYLAGLPIKDDKWKATELKRREWITAELQRRARLKAASVPSAEDIREGARQPRNPETHADLNEQAAAAAEAEPDDYSDIPFDAQGNLIADAQADERTAHEQEFAPTETTPEFPPAEAPADALDAPLGATWHNRLIDGMIRYGYATDAGDAQRRIEAVAQKKAQAGEPYPLNRWAAKQIENMSRKPGPLAQS